MTETVASTDTESKKEADGDTRRRIWAIVGASSGNLVEWFDFYVYSFCSLYFAHISQRAKNVHADLSLYDVVRLFGYCLSTRL